jgi:hypothetical protein
MLRLKQNDPRWGDIKMGQSNSTLGRLGCMVTSLCMLHSKFHPDNPYLPDRAATHWVFVPVVGDPEPHYLSWTQTQFSGMKFIWRGYGYDPTTLITDPVTKEKDTTLNILKKYASHKDYGVALFVETKKGNPHWLAAVGKAILGWAASDPANGKMLWFAPYPYKRITGWVIMQKA